MLGLSWLEPGAIVVRGKVGQELECLRPKTAEGGDGHQDLLAGGEVDHAAASSVIRDGWYVW